MPRAAAAPAVSPPRLRRRLTWAFVLVAGVCAGLLAVTSYALVHQARLADSRDRAVADARYQLVLAGQFLPLDAQRRTALLRSFESSGRHVVLADGDRVTASHPEFAPQPPEELRSRAAEGALGYHRLDAGSRRLLLVGGRIPGSDAELYVVHSEDRLRSELRYLGLVLLLGWLVVAGLASVTGHLVARRALEPVGRASAAARAVAEGLLDTRLPVRGRDEFGAWADSFNRMAEALSAKLAALAAAQTRERRFTADVAHELRTPVTALVAEASLLQESLERLPAEARRPAELLIADVVRLRRLVEELMEISRLDAGAEPVRIEPVDLAGLISALLAARGWQQRVRLELSPDLATVMTDPRRAERVLGNLIDNAVEHGGGAVAVSGRRVGDAVLLTVSDEGPGIPPEELPHVFDRFSKGDGARSGHGSGLGMAIARQNADLLGGALEVESPPGQGVRCRFRLPVAPLLHDGEVPDGTEGEREKHNGPTEADPAHRRPS